jgi:hypothetical protein
MSKHTPGPWFYAESEVGTPFVDSESVGDLSAVALPLDEQKANAHLIAAAPDLLAALEDLLPDLQCWCDVAFTARGKHQPNTLCHHEENVKAAIAKAKGQS